MYMYISIYISMIDVEGGKFVRTPNQEWGGKPRNSSFCCEGNKKYSKYSGKLTNEGIYENKRRTVI